MTNCSYQEIPFATKEIISQITKVGDKDVRIGMIAVGYTTYGTGRAEDASLGELAFVAGNIQTVRTGFGWLGDNNYNEGNEAKDKTHINSETYESTRTRVFGGKRVVRNTREDIAALRILRHPEWVNERRDCRQSISSWESRGRQRQG